MWCVSPAFFVRPLVLESSAILQPEAVAEIIWVSFRVHLSFIVKALRVNHLFLQLHRHGRLPCFPVPEGYHLVYQICVFINSICGWNFHVLRTMICPAKSLRRSFSAVSFPALTITWCMDQEQRRAHMEIKQMRPNRDQARLKKQPTISWLGFSIRLLHIKYHIGGSITSTCSLLSHHYSGANRSLPKGQPCGLFLVRRRL